MTDTPRTVHVTLDNERTYDVQVREERGRLVATVDGREVAVDLRDEGPDRLVGLVDGRRVALDLRAGTLGLFAAQKGRSWQVRVDDAVRHALRQRATAPREHAEAAEALVCSPITGVVTRVLAEPGAAVSAGQPLLLVEAMKMENRVVAPRAGCVLSIEAAPGDRVRPGQLLARVGGLE
jgi:biotin carboxyl carrier protein